MTKYLLICSITIALFLPVTSHAQNTGSDTIIPREIVDPSAAPLHVFYRARVIKIISDEQRESGPRYTIRSQSALLKILNGDKKGTEITIEKTDTVSPLNQGQWLSQNQQVVIAELTDQDGTSYEVVDHYRLPSLVWILAVFLLLAIVFARLKGFMSIVGLAFSILVLIKFIVPNILAGKNPLVVTLIGSGIIAVVAIYLAHGFKKRTSVAVASTLITLAIATGLSYVFVHASKLLGLGSEEAFYLQAGFGNILNLQGLLLSGIIIGTLGVLDDVTTSQTAAVDEIANADPTLTFSELYSRGLSVGKEHIASLINTLVLAYAGASLPLFLLFTLQASPPWWVTLNSEFVAEEIVRTLVGSSALIIAVPIATALSAYYLRKQK